MSPLLFTLPICHSELVEAEPLGKWRDDIREDARSVSRKGTSDINISQLLHCAGMTTPAFDAAFGYVGQLVATFKANE